MAIYGYVRVSTKTQNLERQLSNITSAYDNIDKIYQDKFTGTKTEGRIEFNKLLKIVKAGDTIVFDSVSRMSRNAEEGFQLYKELLNKGIDLIFLKEPHINTTTYKIALNNKIDSVGNEIADIYIKATNQVIEVLAEQQIKLAFEQSAKEVTDLQQRTKEGIKAKRLLAEERGEEFKIGRQEGSKIVTEKSIKAKELIKKHSKKFGGTLNNKECMQLIGCAKASFYKYVEELMNEEV